MNVLRGQMIRVLLIAAIAISSLGLMGLARRPAPTSTPSTSNPVPAIPEPTGFVVFAIGAGVVGLALHRRSRKS